MSSNTKVLIPNKEWLLTNDNYKIGSISRSKKGYSFLCKGKKVDFDELEEITSQFGITVLDNNLKKITGTDNKIYYIYDYPCSSKAYEPVYSIRKKLPLYAKSSKSKSQYCAGYYIIKFRKGWVKSFCPKLITLDRYPYHGPFKTEIEMKNMLNSINKS